MAYPLGALCILSSLRHDSITSGQTRSDLFEYLADTNNPIHAAQEVAAEKPHMVGLSIYLYNRDWFEAFIREFKRISPKTILFAGGAEVTANGESLLDEGVSFLIIGEGEETVVTAVRQLLVGESVQANGIITKEHPERTLANPLDLSGLESPLLSGIVNPSEYSGVLWEMTRGCPFHCAFCFESRGERTVRTYPMHRIEKELDILIKHHVKRVFVLDPTFNMDRERTVHILTLLRDNAPSDMEFTFEVRAELIDETVAELFSEVFCCLQIGLQSSSPAILKTINRKFDPLLFQQKMDLLNSFGVVFGLDLIIGLPGDSLQTFEDSLAYAIAQKPSNIDIFPLAVLPGTQLADDALSFGLTYQPVSPYLIQESPTMSASDLVKAMQLKQACDRFYTEGNAAMWFHCACTGVAMTASQFLYAFHDFLTCNDITGELEIFTLQDTFVRDLYGKCGKEKLLPALLSYMELHQGLSFYQDTGESPVMELSYSPQDLALLDSTSLEKFTRKNIQFKGPRHFAVYEEDGEYIFEEVTY
jgi:hypothetical protein